MLPCGDANRYCPGLFEDPFRYGVQLAWYSAPEGAPFDQRSFELPCEQNRYCESGIAQFCNRDYCWPMPLSITAREALPGETDARGNPYIPALGIGVGDVIEFQFDERGTEPLMNTTELVLSLLDFSEVIAVNLVGRWVNPTLLYVTISEGNWYDAGATDPELTRIGALKVKTLASGNLRCVGSS